MTVYLLAGSNNAMMIHLTVLSEVCISIYLGRAQCDEFDAGVKKGYLWLKVTSVLKMKCGCNDTGFLGLTCIRISQTCPINLKSTSALKVLWLFQTLCIGFKEISKNKFNLGFNLETWFVCWTVLPPGLLNSKEDKKVQY